MERYERIARRLAVTETVVASLSIQAGNLFGEVFQEIREKAKKMKEDASQKAGAKLERTVSADMKSKGVPVISWKVSLGKYRGSRFVTSAKLKVKVKDEKAAKSLLAYLNDNYSPKFKLKKFSEETNEADYNVR